MTLLIFLEWYESVYKAECRYSSATFALKSHAKSGVMHSMKSRVSHAFALGTSAVRESVSRPRTALIRFPHGMARSCVLSLLFFRFPSARQILLRTQLISVWVSNNLYLERKLPSIILDRVVGSLYTVRHYQLPSQW